METMQSRRRFMAGLSAVGAAGLALAPKSLHAEPPPETTTIRLPQWVGGAYCWAAEYIAGELLRAEGFTDVRFVQGDPKVDQWVWIARGDTDFTVNHPPLHVVSIEAGVPIKVLAGLHSGCMELIANDSVRSIADLRNKRVGIKLLNSTAHMMLTLVAAYVGLDPVKDIQWVVPEGSLAELFVEGKIDAFLGSPPEPQELRARKIGHVVVNSDHRSPMVAIFLLHVVRQRGICAQVSGRDQARLARHSQGRGSLRAEPQRVAQQLVDGGFHAPV